MTQKNRTTPDPDPLAKAQASAQAAADLLGGPDTAQGIVDGSHGESVQLGGNDEAVTLPNFDDDGEVQVQAHVIVPEGQTSMERAAAIVMGESKKLEEAIGETFGIAEAVFELRSKFSPTTLQVDNWVTSYLVTPNGTVYRTSSPHVLEQLKRLKKFAGGPPPWVPPTLVKVTQVAVPLPGGKGVGRTFRLNPITVGRPVKK